jgi:hypothetical protein
MLTPSFKASSNVELSHTSKSGGESASLNAGGSVTGGVPGLGGFGNGFSSSAGSYAGSSSENSDNSVGSDAGVLS